MYESQYHGDTAARNGHGLVERKVRELLDPSGIQINGPNPWDIRVNDPRFYGRIMLKGSLGLGESYMDGWWECEQLDEFFCRILSAPLSTHNRFASHFVSWVRANLINLQTDRRAFQVAEAHYDLGNDIYEAMLDKRMVYTCAFWENAGDLDEAQEHKLDLVCRKLDLHAGMKVLDIGCGWGSFARFAAENYAVKVVGITISKEQAELGAQRCRGLAVEIRLQDYRDLDETFDSIVSLGMIEHVGHKNYATYFDIIERCLGTDGLCLVQTIGKNDSRPGTDPWIERYIFPNGEVPSIKQLAQATESRLVVEDMHNFGPDYDRTLMAWFRNFDRAWPELRHKYPERFYRTWKYYLHSCAGAFRARDIQLWQLVFSSGVLFGGYRRP